MGLVKRPETFLQFLLSPPQTPHLSNFLLDPSFPSQPALMHLPWTQTDEESGEHGVPSTTYKKQKKNDLKCNLIAAFYSDYSFTRGFLIQHFFFIDGLTI